MSNSILLFSLKYYDSRAPISIASKRKFSWWGSYYMYSFLLRFMITIFLSNQTYGVTTHWNRLGETNPMSVTPQGLLMNEKGNIKTGLFTHSKLCDDSRIWRSRVIWISHDFSDKQKFAVEFSKVLLKRKWILWDVKRKGGRELGIVIQQMPKVLLLCVIVGLRLGTGTMCKTGC